VVDEIFTSPKQVENAVARVLEVVDAVAAGRAKQRFWWKRSGTEPFAAQAWVQLVEDGRWVRFQSWGNVPWPGFRRWYRSEDVPYAPYS
jgi:hypothetical protein